MPDTIIVHIDNSLWDFASVLYERMRMVNPAVSPPSMWRGFDVSKAYMPRRTFFSLIKGIHSVLFADCYALVDDSPETLEKAKPAATRRAGLQFPWHESEDHPLFDGLQGVLGYLVEESDIDPL